MTIRIDYGARLRLIRPYTRGFDARDGYPIRTAQSLSSARKAQINKYYNALTALTARAFHVWRPRRKDHLQAGLKATGVGGYKRFKAIFIQSPTKLSLDGERQVIKPTSITVSKAGHLKVRFGNIEQSSLVFENLGYDNVELLTNTREVINEIIEEHPFKRYTIMSGEFEVGRGVPTMYKADELEDKITELLDKYSAADHDPNDKSSSYYGNWLFGLRGYSFKNVRQIGDYVKEHRAFKTKREGVMKKIINAKKYLDKLIKERTALRRSRKLSAKQKATRLKTKEKQIKNQHTKISRLVIERTHI